MKLILLYGPPGVGKLTTAKTLQRLTGYPLVLNHLIVNLVSAVFPKDHHAGRRQALNLMLRRAVYESAARTGMPGLISTFNHYGRRDPKRTERALHDVTRTVRAAGGSVFLVRLSCEPKELERRITSPSRRGSGKVTDVQTLRRILREEEPCAELPREIANCLALDNTFVDPETAARRIMRFCGI